MRHRYLLSLVVTAGILAALPSAAAQVDDGGPSLDGGGLSGDFGGGPAGFFGFSRIQSVAQGQLGTGYFFAIGDEVNRVVGARAEMAGPPINTRSTAAFIQRGVGATYVYGVAGGPGGTSGALPDPPPGEAPAYWPTEPNESTFEGPVTAALDGSDGRDPRTVDGRFHASATEQAAALADAAVTRVQVPGYFAAEGGSVVSRSSPVPTGFEAESVSVVNGLVIGPLRIETLVSRAYGFVPSLPGEPKAVASTVVEGATVGKVPVKITDNGVVAADQTSPDVQAQVQEALKGAGISDVRLLGSLSKPDQDGQQVSAEAGTLQVVRNDHELGNQNPQGFRGGGFAIGGAEVTVTGTRCEPACAGPPGESDAPGLSFESPSPASSTSADSAFAEPPVEDFAGADSAIGALDPAAEPSIPAGSGPDAATAGFVDPTGGFPAGSVTATTDTTPEVPFTTAAGSATTAPPVQPPSRQAILAAVSGYGAANSFRHIFLALAGALAVVSVLGAVVRAR